MLHRAPQNNPFCPFFPPSITPPQNPNYQPREKQRERESNEEMVQWVERIFFFPAGENSKL
jgi:hypothetical protein